MVPQDLLPVVAPDSDTARAARASAAARHRVKTWLYVGIGATIASAVVLGSFVFGGSSPVPEEYLFPGAALATAVPFYAARHEHQEELQGRYTGGTVFHVYLPERISSAAACRDLVRRTLSRFRVPYLTITPTFSICPNHGYLAGRHEFCPKCDAELLAKQSACCTPA